MKLQHSASTILLIVLINTWLFLRTVRASSCMEPYCECIDSKSLSCNNFTSFDELNFRRLNGRPFESIELFPRWQLDLDEKLKFSGLVLNGRLTLSNLRSINAFYNPFRQILLYRFDLTIQDSEFNFFSANQRPDVEKAILSDCEFKIGKLTGRSFFFL